VATSTDLFLITGATGNTGAHTVRLLRERGLRVRALVRTLDDRAARLRAPARSSFTGMLRDSSWDATDLVYFLGYAWWNYLTAPFLFTYPGVQATEIEPWREAGKTWRRLKVQFPPSIATHSRQQVFYFDLDGLQRRIDYTAEVAGSALVGRHTSRHKDFDGLLVPTRRRVFRRNPDNSVNLDVCAITLDIRDAELIRVNNEQEIP
jgi:NAD(P)-dependent dehydrogenase (short-subunit alcohol dehydrogenase family)